MNRSSHPSGCPCRKDPYRENARLVSEALAHSYCTTKLPILLTSFGNSSNSARLSTRLTGPMNPLYNLPAGSQGSPYISPSLGPTTRVFVLKCEKRRTPNLRGAYSRLCCLNIFPLSLPPTDTYPSAREEGNPKGFGSAKGWLLVDRR